MCEEQDVCERVRLRVCEEQNVGVQIIKVNIMVYVVIKYQVMM